MNVITQLKMIKKGDRIAYYDSADYSGMQFTSALNGPYGDVKEMFQVIWNLYNDGRLVMVQEKRNNRFIYWAVGL